MLAISKVYCRCEGILVTSLFRETSQTALAFVEFLPNISQERFCTSLQRPTWTARFRDRKYSSNRMSSAPSFCSTNRSHTFALCQRTTRNGFDSFTFLPTRCTALLARTILRSLRPRHTHQTVHIP